MLVAAQVKYLKKVWEIDCGRSPAKPEVGMFRSACHSAKPVASWECGRKRPILLCETEIRPSAQALPKAATGTRSNLVLDPDRYVLLPDQEAPQEILQFFPEGKPMAGRFFVRNSTDDGSGGTHFLHHTSQGTHCLQRAVYYAEADPEDGLVRHVLSAWYLGAGTSGHPGVCHGGCLALDGEPLVLGRVLKIIVFNNK